MAIDFDRQWALQQYQIRAPFYDRELAAIEPVRRIAVARLQLQPGDTVLDVGCGTGLSFEMLQCAVGRHGRVVGIEQSPEMLALARARVAQHGWKNVWLIESPVEVADMTLQADAALFHFTHDILRDGQALANVLQHLKPRSRVVAAGLQWAAVWDWPTNWGVLLSALHSVSSLAQLDKPWIRLAEQIGGMDDISSPCSGIYVASGVSPG
jgi:precorrin-6B methylase 2